MKGYTTLIFDAFDTLIHVNRLELPACQVDGKLVNTTAPGVRLIYEQYFGTIDRADFYRAFAESHIQTEKIRAAHLRELSSQERFRIMLELLGHDGGGVDDAILDQFTLAHMEGIQRVLEVRQDTLSALEWAAPRYRRAIISNFDYAPALYRCLDRYRIRHLFETITISVELGWRKPHPAIFERTLHTLDIRPSEALFIGDQLDLDVLGGVQAGLDVVWIDTGQEPWTSAYPKPTYTIQSLAQLKDILV